MEVRTVSDLRKVFQDYTDLIENDLFPLAQKNNNVQAMQRLRQVWERLQQGPIRVLFLGVSSAGKSTILNAMTGHVIVPEGQHTTSPIPVWIYSDERADISPHFRTITNQGNNSLPHKNNLSGAEFMMEYCYTPEQAAEGTAQKKYQDLIAASVNLQCDYMKDSGITLIDAPGIGASTGDNSRVTNLIKHGCELVMIVFRNMEEPEKIFLQDTFTNTDAPLGHLLKSKRIFAIHNVFERPTTAVAKGQIQEAFRGHLPVDEKEKRLFFINALQTRLAVCGEYEHSFLMQGTFSDQAFSEANDFIKNERKREAKVRKELAPYLEALRENAPDLFSDPAKADALRALLEKHIKMDTKQRGVLNDLWTALQDRAQELIRSPEEVTALLAPIQKGINEAIGFLIDDYDKAIGEARAREYAAPQDLMENLMRIPQRQHMLLEMSRCVADVFGNDPTSKLSTFLSDTCTNIYGYRTQTIYKVEALEGYRLINDTRAGEDAVLLEGFDSSDWSRRVVENILFPRSLQLQEELVKQIKDDITLYSTKTMTLSGHCSVFWEEYKSLIQDILAFYSDKRKSRFICLANPDSTLSRAHDTAVKAVADAQFMRMDADKREEIRAYLRLKQEMILSAPFTSGMRKLFLSTNLIVDHLNPHRWKASNDSIQLYLDTFVQTLKKTVQNDLQLFQKELDQEEKHLVEDYRTLQKKIDTAKEKEKQEQIDLLKQKRKKLREKMLF